MKIISQILIVAIFNLTCSYSYAWVDSTTTTVAIHKKSITQIYRQQLLDLADRQEVIDQLVQYGVTKEEAINRINSLTDEEINFFLRIWTNCRAEEKPRHQWANFFIVVLFPILVILGMVWVISKVISP